LVCVSLESTWRDKKMNGYEKFGWKKYGPTKVFEHADCFYQKKIVADVSAEIVEYSHTVTPVWELHFQIDQDRGKAINVNVFTYEKLDFPKMERDAKKIIERLIDEETDIKDLSE